MKKIFYTLSFLLLFSTLNFAQDDSSFPLKLQIDPSVGMLFLSNSVLEETLGIQSQLPQWSAGGGVRLRLISEEPLESIISIQRITRISGEGEYMYLGSYAAILGWRFNLGEAWTFVPGLGFHAISGLYEREVASYITPGPLPIGNYSKWYFDQMGLMVSADLAWKLPNSELKLLPQSVFFNIQYGAPIGPGLLEYSGTNPIEEGRKPLFAYNLSLSFGVSYRLIGAGGKQ